MNSFDTRYMQFKIKKLEDIINKQAKVTHVVKELNMTCKTVHIWLLRYKRYCEDGVLSQKRKSHGIAKNKTP